MRTRSADDGPEKRDDQDRREDNQKNDATKLHEFRWLSSVTAYAVQGIVVELSYLP